MTLMSKPLCNIEVLKDHVVGAVGIHNHAGYTGQVPMDKGQRLVGVYLFETTCGTFTCCLVDGHPLYFDAGKVKITGMANRYFPESEGGDCWVGDRIVRQTKTFYVVDSETHERALCKSWKHAEKEAERLNRELVQEGAT